jgi:hypothetical protein
VTTQYALALEKQVELIGWTHTAGADKFSYDLFGNTTWLRVLRAALPIASTLFVSKDICDLVALSGRKLPAFRPTVDVVPDTLGGFVWLEEPIARAPLLGKERAVRALLWLFCRLPGSTYAQDGVGIIATTENTELAIVPFCEISGHLFPWFFFEWPWTETQLEAITREQMYSDENHTDYDATLASACYGFLSSLWLFMKQRVLVGSHQSVERHVRKRLERQGWTERSLVTVVQLRRRESVVRRDPINETDVIEWSCKWIVRGHWRQQFYPSKHMNIPIWITPYVKGPDDKPLKPPRATIFAVVR